MCSVGTYPTMCSWTIDHVCHWLDSIGVGQEAIGQFRSEKVDGRVLSDITRDELKNEFSTLRFGERKTIMMEIEKVKAKEAGTNYAGSRQGISDMPTTGTGRRQSTPHRDSVSEGDQSGNTSPKEMTEHTAKIRAVECSHVDLSGRELLKCSEICRTFDRIVKVTDKYTHHDVLSCSEGQQQDLLEPIHRFVLTDLSKDEGKFTLASETVRFACACLNDRTNGTLHFGVASRTSGSEKTGEILGTCLSGEQQVYERFVRKAISTCFVPEQRDIALACVRPLKFIEVIPTKATPTFVVEIDVVPMYSLCEEEAFFILVPRPKTGEGLQFEKQAVYSWRDNSPTEIHDDELIRFMKFKQKLAETRKEREQQNMRRFDSTDYSMLKDKLVNLLCLGEDGFIGDVYPILVISKPADYMDQSYMKENMNFLHTIEWKAVFDFDEKAAVCDFIINEDQLIKISTTADDFYSRSNKNIGDPDRLKSLEEDIRNSIPYQWIFVNGHSRTGVASLDPYEWKKQKREGFKKAVDFFASEIPAGRAIVVFVLLSKEWKVMLEAAEEFFSAFPDQWMCIAKEESVFQPWNEELLRRHCIDKESTENHVIGGMPWEHVQEAVQQIRGPSRTGECMLHTSTGALVPLKKITLNELGDLDVLSAVQCENAKIQDSDKLDDYRKKMEETFYKGGEVDWWNFYFPENVLERTIGKKAKELAQKELQNDSNGHIGKVTVYHEPGAGGTTTCKHILWDLRKTRRCAIVRNISEQTHKQILKLWSFKDDHPKAIVVLLDNQDEEKSRVLQAMLEETAKQMTREEPSRQQIPVCVLLVCRRHSTLSGRKAPSGTMMVSLKHELDERELMWFKRKYKELEENYEENSGVDPKHLISFNILKENFDQGYIKRTVTTLLDDITCNKERLLLKYIALVNAFELGFHSLPTCAFDTLMVDLPYAPGPRRGPHAVSFRWETNLSKGIRILTNEVYSQGLGYIHSIRITSPLLSNVILTQLRKRPNEVEEPLSKVVADFFDNNDIFKQKCHARDKLLKSVKAMLVTRARLPSGLPEGMFSPLVQEVIDKETMEIAALMLQHGYRLTEDPFVSQQIARLYMHMKDWPNAETYAKYATDKMPSNSFVWDTYGRVFLNQVAEKYRQLSLTEQTKIQVDEVIPVIDTASRGIEVFRKAQQIADNERHMSSNNAGYIGEIEITVALLDCLNFVQVFSDIDVLHRFLVDEEYVPDGISCLFDFNGQDYVSRLKQLQWDVRKVLVRLDDESEQLHEEMNEHRRKIHEKVRLKKKTELHIYFGEASETVPDTLSNAEKCQYRRRLLFQRDTDTLGGIFSLLHQVDAERKLCEVSNLIAANIRLSATPDAYDLRAMICVNLALLHIHDKYLNMIKYEDMVAWSRRLYELRDTVPFIWLEPYLFFMMFNWPRKNTSVHLRPTELNAALRQWKETYYQKYPRQLEEGKPYRRTDNTKFFLANGSDMASITTFDQLDRRQFKGDAFWRYPHVLRKLQRFRGHLSHDGVEVMVNLQCASREDTVIQIPTSFPIGNRTMWNQTVFFVIGFSWFGPKAFDVSREDPTEDVTYMVADNQNQKPMSVYRQTARNRTDKGTHQWFMQQLNPIVDKLRRIKELQRLKRPLTRDEVRFYAGSRHLRIEKSHNSRLISTWPKVSQHCNMFLCCLLSKSLIHS